MPAKNAARKQTNAKKIEKDTKELDDKRKLKNSRHANYWKKNDGIEFFPSFWLFLITINN